MSTDLLNEIRLEINGVILDTFVPFGMYVYWLIFFCLLLMPNYLTLHDVRDSLDVFSGIGYLVDAADSEVLRASIKELEDIVDD